MRLACDTGGTFTDLIVEDNDGSLKMYKAATTPSDPVSGVLDAVALAAEDRGVSIGDFFADVEMLIHGTTHAINAIVTGNTAKTAFLTTEGHPDVLVLREAGRMEPFNFKVPYPKPYIPRALTVEIPERVAADGTVVKPLDEEKAIEHLEALKAQGVEALAVCLLWSVSNGAHELRLAELIEKILPGVPYSLSHQLNPSIREYRRGSSTAIDASLKPLMGKYMGGLQKRLSDAGFDGRLLVLTSQGGMLEAEELARNPIHAINSGPSMAPLAGRHYAEGITESPTVVVADTGGTTYDVSVVSAGQIPMTRDMWIGEPYRGHLTGFPSVDVKSVGAGGGSIARVDSGGLLQVGPQSAGADPGPACFQKGGARATLTDACVVTGIIDPDYFLGGTFPLSLEKARTAIETDVAGPLGLDVAEAAALVIELATENMVQAITDITINQGIDPSKAVLMGGGGAAGLNSVWIGRRLGCNQVVIPDTGPALSAAGALMSDLAADYQATFHTASDNFDYDGVGKLLAGLTERVEGFKGGVARNAVAHDVSFAIEARYDNQVWEIEVPLARGKIENPDDLAAFIASFHSRHEELFAYSDEASDIEFVTWIIRVRSALRRRSIGYLDGEGKAGVGSGNRKVYFRGHGWRDTSILSSEDLTVGAVTQGPTIIETPFTSVVVDPDASIRLADNKSLVIDPFANAVAETGKTVELKNA